MEEIKIENASHSVGFYVSEIARKHNLIFSYAQVHPSERNVLFKYRNVGIPTLLKNLRIHIGSIDVWRAQNGLLKWRYERYR